MFKSTRRKIVAAIMAGLILLLLGSLAIIYGFSYREVANQNYKMMEHYVDRYDIEEHAEKEVLAKYGITKNPKDELGNDDRNPHFEGEDFYEISTFYSVAFSTDGQPVALDNDKTSTYTDEQLTDMAEVVLEKDKVKGKMESLLSFMEEEADQGFMLVVFMDNTVMQQSVNTLFKYTLIFGGAIIILLFFLSIYLAGKIVRPLEDNYERQRQFISDAGHELKTPVAVVNANAELLAREIGQNQWLDNIQYENERMNLLVTQLLDLARTEQKAAQMEEVDFSRLVSGETLPFESVAFEKGLSFSYDIEDDIKVHGSASQLKQLVSILLDNAVSHCSEASDINLTLKEQRSFAVLSVINDGKEIPEEQRKHIFERFYRADEARNDEDGHYGLGLPIANAIAGSHQGKIDVACNDGKIEFTVKLPIQK